MTMNKTNKKNFKVIIDTDPGVDDSACLILTLTDNDVDVKLITTVSGNVSLQKSTRNALHLLDLLKIDVPVAKGAIKALTRVSPNAEFIHQKEGLGGYIPPKTTLRKPIKEDAVEIMYKILKEGDGDIAIMELAPHTNLGKLLQKHPDIIEKIPCIYFEGGSPYGVPGFPDHISFNISSDPEAFKIVLDSHIPLKMIPSDMGRRKGHLDEKFVEKLKNTNQVGNFLYQMYSKYWEPNFPDKRIATNDTCVYFLMKYPKLFKTVKCDINVDTEEEIGKTYINFNNNGNVEMAVEVNQKKLLKLIYKKIKKLNKIKFS